MCVCILTRHFSQRMCDTYYGQMVHRRIGAAEAIGFIRKVNESGGFHARANWVAARIVLWPI